MNKDKIKKKIRDSYAKIVDKGCSCSCNFQQFNNKELAKSIGYSEEELNQVPEANIGLGCGNPTILEKIEKGMTVLDLGSGAGFDCFLAAKKVGSYGKVIGVDMTEEMILKAKNNAKKSGYNNVEFKIGEIENLPIDKKSIDLIISNCVINLSPEKSKVFEESYRVLKKGGKMLISDIVLIKSLSEVQKNDSDLIASCIGGAILKEDYIELIRNVGFEVKIISEDKEISKRQYQGFPVESIKIIAYKI